MLNQNNLDRTDIIMVVDKSGSMHAIAKEASDGIQNFIATQKSQPGHATLTVVEFDDQYDIVVNGEDIQDVETITIEPRGMTALHDAIGRTIEGATERISAIPFSERPGKVVFVVITDGEENASSKYTGTQIRDLIAAREKDSWQFTFIGASQEVVSQGVPLGFDPNLVVRNSNTRKGAAGTYVGLANTVNTYRSSTVTGASMTWSDEDRELALGNTVSGTSASTATGKREASDEA